MVRDLGAPGLVLLVLGPEETNKARRKPENSRDECKCERGLELAALVAVYGVDIIPVKDAAATLAAILKFRMISIILHGL